MRLSRSWTLAEALILAHIMKTILLSTVERGHSDLITNRTVSGLSTAGNLLYSMIIHLLTDVSYNFQSAYVPLDTASS